MPPNKTKNIKLSLEEAIWDAFCIEESRAICRIYIAETGENLHVGMKSPFPNKNLRRRTNLGLFPISQTHRKRPLGVQGGKKRFEDLFEIDVFIDYYKLITKQKLN